jgi:hypothetical protein
MAMSERNPKINAESCRFSYCCKHPELLEFITLVVFSSLDYEPYLQKFGDHLAFVLLLVTAGSEIFLALYLENTV